MTEVETFSLVRYTGPTPIITTPVASIVGSWAIEGVPAEDIRITFGADGSYAYYYSGVFDEQGTYVWDKPAGIVTWVVENLILGECAIPEDDSLVYRYYPNRGGETLQLHYNDGRFDLLVPIP